METNAIYINVSAVITSEIGEVKKYDFKFDGIYIDELFRLEAFKGQINITNVGEGLLANIIFKPCIIITCSRCAKDFKLKQKINYQQVFKNNPSEDEFDINNNNINIWPSVIQEIILSIPMKPLCNKCK